MITAFYAMEEHTRQVRPLYYASIAYACILIWERIFPDYEPIYCGWFADWGNMILIAAIGYSLIKNMIHSYLQGLAFQEEHHQMEKQLTMQHEYTRQISDQIEKNRKLIHDFRHHLRTLSVFSEKEQDAELQTYLDHISDEIFLSESISSEIFSNTPAVNALLQYYYTYAKQQDIKVNFQWVPNVTVLSDIEFCTLLGNLLENAIDACKHQAIENVKKIELFTKETEHMIFICIENTYDGIFEKQEDRFLSRKHKNTNAGIGLESVRDIVECHNGDLDICPEENIFRVRIDLPIK